MDAGRGRTQDVHPQGPGHNILPLAAESDCGYCFNKNHELKRFRNPIQHTLSLHAYKRTPPLPLFLFPSLPDFPSIKFPPLFRHSGPVVLTM